MKRLSFDLTISVSLHLSPCDAAATPIDVKFETGSKHHKHGNTPSYRASDGSNIVLVGANLTREIEMERRDKFVSDNYHRENRDTTHSVVDAWLCVGQGFESEQSARLTT